MTAPVVLLPSLGRGAGDFDRLVADLGAAGFSALAVDPVAALERAGAADALTLHDLARGVVAVIDDAGIDSFHLIGHAFGQRVARCLTADFGERVLSLTLLACGGYVDPPPEISASLQSCFDLDLPPAEHLEHVRRVFFADGNDPSVWAGGWLPNLAAAQAAAVQRTDRADWWDAVAPRVMVLQGLQDAMAPIANGRRYVADHPDVAELVELDGAGHALLPEQPEAIVSELVRFLAG